MVDEGVSNDDAPLGRPIKFRDTAYRTAADEHQPVAQTAALPEDVSILHGNAAKKPALTAPPMADHAAHRPPSVRSM